MLELGVIADDLTGGMMVASLLEREGVNCPLITSVEAMADLPDSADAVVIGRKIRLIPANEAVADAQRSAQAFLDHDAKRIYYKYCATFDSTDEGNIGPIGEGLMQTMKTDRVIFCPAFPEYTVTIFEGRMFLGNTMLGDSMKQYDPVTPMTNSNLVEVLQAQCEGKVGLLPHGVLARGMTAAEAHVQAQIDKGAHLFVVDAADNEDVTRIAQLATQWPLTTGADALPMFLARTWMAEQGEVAQTTVLPPAPGHAAVIAGSCAPATLRQVVAFAEKHPVYQVDLLDAADDSNIVEKIAAWADDHLADGPVCVTTSADVEGVKRAQEKLGRDGAATLADNILGRSAQALHERGVRKFVVAGGETSGQVIGTLGVQQVQVSSFDNLGGGYCHAAGPDPLSLVLKAGALGDDQFFFTALERMRAADAA